MFYQDDPKKCTAAKLIKFGLAKKITKSQPKTILLHPYAQKTLFNHEKSIGHQEISLGTYWQVQISIMDRDFKKIQYFSLNIDNNIKLSLFIFLNFRLFSICSIDFHWCSLIFIASALFWLDLTWSDLIWLDQTWSALIWLHLTWSDLIWLDGTWFDLIWLDLTWFSCELIWLDLILILLVYI